MSDPINERDLEQEEHDLLYKLQMIREEKLLKQKLANEAALIEARKRENEKEIKITVKSIVGTFVLIHTYPVPRPDLQQILDNTPGHQHRSYGDRYIPIGQWIEFRKNVAELKNINWVYSGEMSEQKILDIINAPAWEIELGRTCIGAKPGPFTHRNTLQFIPGAMWEDKRLFWKIPFQEAWRLTHALENVDGVVVWSQEAKEFVLNQFEKRAKLDEIASLEHGIIYKDFKFPNATSEVKLRPFQEVGCEFIDATEGKALVADVMGLGKTIQAIAYAEHNKFAQTLVICPASLKPNWAREIKRLTGESPYICVGSEPSTFDMEMLLVRKPRFVIINYDILSKSKMHSSSITDTNGWKHEKNERVYMWVKLLNAINFDLMVMDEGHYIKNVDSNRSEATRKLSPKRLIVLTGTPVLNRPGELWPILTLLRPDLFPSFDQFIKQYTYDGKSARNISELRLLLKSIMIRRLKKDVLKDLPPINRINEYHELSEKAAKLYARVELGIWKAIDAYNPSGEEKQEESITSILAKIQRLKMVCAIDKAERTAELAHELYENSVEGEESAKKVLIFTQYLGVGHKISRLLGHECLSFIQKRGKGKDVKYETVDLNERDRIVQEFQSNPKMKFLVVTRGTATEGLNITAAGSVIFNDLFWTPAAHEQAEGRAYGRLSDLHSINSYYMVTDMDGDSIEEWIMQLLADKLAMIEEVVEGVENDRDVSIANALIEKMKEKMIEKKASGEFGKKSKK